MALETPFPGITALRASLIPQRMGPAVRLGTAELPSVALLRQALYPCAVVLTLLASCAIHGHEWQHRDVTLSIIACLLSAWTLGQAELTRWSGLKQVSAAAKRLLGQWAFVVAMLLFIAFATKTSADFSRRVMITWFAAAPFVMIGAQAVAQHVIRKLVAVGALMRTHVIVGANQVGCELARRLGANSTFGTFIGFFDDRDPTRLPSEVAPELLGELSELANYARRNAISAIHIALPCTSQPRIQNLLEELRDTTASIYLVPDIVFCDLMQARMLEVDGLPLVAIRESPFCGLDGIVKRCVDVVTAGAALSLAVPLMAIIALAIRLTSAGPAFFKQRRYGLGGEEIVIYKFRTMTVCEDGDHIAQATKHDARVTPIGRFLRSTSLDELPQLLNVLNGSMSMVGPRPHAIAHNEEYRRLIPGYMLRHKVRPGITGWAQVNGLRGETETIAKMQLRVAYDLDYLRNWSMTLDLKILFRTAWIVLFDRRAY